MVLHDLLADREPNARPWFAFRHDPLAQIKNTFGILFLEQWHTTQLQNEK